MMKKLVLALLCLLTLILVGCNPNDPSVSFGDPEGTIPLSMRNASNGKTYLEDFLYIDSGDNFTCEHIVSVGSVSGLGKISEIPLKGWSDHVAVLPGNGYVACSGQVFYRIYVVDYVRAVGGGVIGADVKYQGPFYGKDVKIAFEEQSVTVPAGATCFVPFKTEEVVAGVKIECSEGWCHARLSPSFLYKGIQISTDPVEEITSASATVKVTTSYGKSAEISVVRLGASPYLFITKAWNNSYSDLSFQPLNFDEHGYYCYSNEVKLSLQSNCDLNGITFAEVPKWLHVTASNEIVQLTCDVNKTVYSREANIIISTADGKASCELHVTQKAGVFELYETPEKVYFDRIGGYVTYRIHSSFEPNITCSETSWIICRYNNGYLQFTCVGGCETDRTAIIHFEGIDQTIEVIQSKYAVGDSYSEGAVTGTVFYMNAGERYIYQDLGNAQWSTEYIITGANTTDPFQNLQAIRNLGHMERYPAFQLWESLLQTDSGWFLPAYDYRNNNNYLRHLPVASLSSNENDQYYIYTTTGVSRDKAEALPVFVVHAF